MCSVHARRLFSSALTAAALAAVLLLAGCAGSPRVPQPQNAAGEVADLAEVPQSLAWFAGRAPVALLRTEDGAARDMRHFRRRFFAAWQSAKPSRDTLKFFRTVLEGSRLGYAENLRPWSADAWAEVRENADMASCPGKARAAITTHGTDLRLAPTLRPRFARVEGAGQGYPFDDLQQTALPVGTPLTVFHATRDGAWFFVETPLAEGWIQARDVAFVDRDVQNLWQSAPLAAFLADGIPLRPAGVYQAGAGLGTVLPLASRNGVFAVFVPVRRPDGYAEAVPVPIPEGKNALVPMPLKFTAQTVARLGDGMLGQSYGWGGLYGNRDCSAMMHDLFVPFGIWLPRNSAAQARSGLFSSLEGRSAKEKDAAILREAEPFRTLLWMKGHIGLYVGKHGGRPVFFHNVWGVRSRLNDGREGRVILGRAVLTTTSPGRERPDVRQQDLLIERMRGMSLIGGRQDD